MKNKPQMKEALEAFNQLKQAAPEVVVQQTKQTKRMGRPTNRDLSAPTARLHCYLSQTTMKSMKRLLVETPYDEHFKTQGEFVEEAIQHYINALREKQ